MDSETENCSFCRSINAIKSSPTRLPAREGECPSLAQQCLQQIAKTPTLLQPDQISNLPIPLLEELKFYLTDHDLFSLSDLFREKGVDTSTAWEIWLCWRFEYRAQECCELGWMEPWIGKTAFLMDPDSQHPCRIYMSKLCQNLIRDISLPCKRGEDLSTMFEKIFFLLELSEIKVSNESDAVTAFLKNLLTGNKLRSLSLDPSYPYKGISNRLLKNLFSVAQTDVKNNRDKTDACKKEEENGNKNNSIKNDEAHHKNKTSDTCLNCHKSALAYLSEIREKIKVLEKSKGEPQAQHEGLQSLSCPANAGKHLIENLKDFVKLLPPLKSIKRLELEIENHCVCPSDSLAMVRSKHLTHLRLTNFSQDLFLLLAVLFENYWCEAQPMEFLGLSNSQNPHLPIFDLGSLEYSYPIAAVRQLELVDLDLTRSMGENLCLFLSYNTPLTHLELNTLRMDPSFEPVSTLLSAVSGHRTLETLVLCNDTEDFLAEVMVHLRTAKDETAVVSLLQTNQQLKHLALREYKVSKQFVSSDSFLKAVTTHGGLEHLSLSNNKLETGAVDLLLAIIEPQAAKSLMRLYLDYRKIPGQTLLEAARSISECCRGRLFLQHLSLCHNKMSKEERLEVQRCFSSCVQLPNIGQHGFDEEEEDESEDDDGDDDDDGGNDSYDDDDEYGDNYDSYGLDDDDDDDDNDEDDDDDDEWDV